MLIHARLVGVILCLALAGCYAQAELPPHTDMWNPTGTEGRVNYWLDAPLSEHQARLDKWNRAALASPYRHGDAYAEYAMGVRYLEGRGVEADRETAIHHFQQSVASTISRPGAAGYYPSFQTGLPEAHYKLWELYRETSPSRAEGHLRSAASQGYRPARKELKRLQAER